MTTPRPADIVLDNPILTRFLRTRLRSKVLIQWLIVVILLSMAIVWAGMAWGLMANSAALTFMVGFEVVLLVFVGAAQVGGAVGGVRESGIIDFHRVSPLPPSWLSTGFFLGAPIREYLLFAATLPFAAFLAVSSPTGLEGWLQILVPLITTAWLLHGVAMTGALLARKPKGGRGAGGGLVVVGLIFGQPIGSGIWYLVRALESGSPSISFFGLQVPWMVFLIGYQLALLVFLFLACNRRFRSDTWPPLSKRQTIACVGTLGVMAVGAAFNGMGQAAVVLAVIYAMTLISCVLIAPTAPSQLGYVRGLRRAMRQGRHRPSLFDDANPNRITVFIVCGLVAVAAMATWVFIADVAQGAGGGAAAAAPGSGLSQSIAIGVFTVAYVGLGTQYFRLRSPRGGTAVMGLVLFAVWLVPILLGSISFWAGTNRDSYTAVLCLSPITGIALVSGQVDNMAGGSLYRLFALAPPITLAFVFNFLLVAAQRRIDLAVRSTHANKKEHASPFDDLEFAAVQDGIK
jgi:hypothetical protein